MQSEDNVNADARDKFPLNFNPPSPFARSGHIQDRRWPNKPCVLNTSSRLRKTQEILNKHSLPRLCSLCMSSDDAKSTNDDNEKVGGTTVVTDCFTSTSNDHENVLCHHFGKKKNSISDIKNVLKDVNCKNEEDTMQCCYQDSQKSKLVSSDEKYSVILPGVRQENVKQSRGRPRLLIKKTHVCSVCHKVFTRKTHLMIHQRIHSNERPFRCDLCFKCFRDNAVLVKHMRTHTKDKPYRCLVCAKSFTQKGNMERHSRQHTNEKPFICTVCTNAFSTKSHLQRHFRIHLNEKPFACELCKKAFRQKSHLMRHVLIHSMEKPYRCNLCHKRFRQAQHVTTHKITHIRGLIGNILSKRCILNGIRSTKM